MGEFEDLIQRARDGDVEALDALETDFSGSSLRKQAEESAAWQKKAEAATPLLRQARFSELVGKLDDDLQDTGLTAEDFGEVEPDSLSLEMVRDRAKTRVEASQTQRLATAQEAGFETVEEYQEALTTVKEQKTAKREGMEAVTSGVASGSGESGEEVSRFDKSHDAFKTAKKDGATDDVALAGFIDVNLAEQSEPAEA